MYTIILNQGIVIRDSDKKIVSPCDSVDDVDFVEYQKWVESGNLPLELAEQSGLNSYFSITARQARLALLQVGLLDSVEAVVNSADSTLQIEWEYGTVIERHSPFVSQVAAALQLTERDIDNLFLLASSL